MSSGFRTEQMFNQINITPLTDVFLVLLVIMILVAPLSNQTVLKVDPPPAAGPPPNPDPLKKVDVEVLSSGLVRIDGVTLHSPNSFAVRQLIRKAQADAGTNQVSINLTADPDALEQDVVTVLDAAAGLQIRRVHVYPMRKLNK